jgi:hypothetical protein
MRERKVRETTTVEGRVEAGGIVADDALCSLRTITLKMLRI